jgi:hypothetical protein
MTKTVCNGRFGKESGTGPRFAWLVAAGLAAFTIHSGAAFADCWRPSRTEMVPCPEPAQPRPPSQGGTSYAPGPRPAPAPGANVPGMMGLGMGILGAILPGTTGPANVPTTGPSPYIGVPPPPPAAAPFAPTASAPPSANLPDQNPYDRTPNKAATLSPDNPWARPTASAPPRPSAPSQRNPVTKANAGAPRPTTSPQADTNQPASAAVAEPSPAAPEAGPQASAEAPARSSGWPCECDRIVGSCTATVSLEDNWITINSTAKSCAWVTYYIGDEPATDTFSGGRAVREWLGPSRNPRTVVDSCRVCAQH